MIDCTRVPFIPTQAPTGSTSRSREKTATGFTFGLSYMEHFSSSSLLVFILKLNIAFPNIPLW